VFETIGGNKAGNCVIRHRDVPTITFKAAVLPVTTDYTALFLGLSDCGAGGASQYQHSEQQSEHRAPPGLVESEKPQCNRTPT
jgi:hypothetical protein